MPNTNDNNKPKQLNKWDICINILTIVGLLVAIFLANSAHQANLKNSEKINQLLVKYEKTLNSAIAGDPSTLKNYRKNLKQAVAGLSPQEKKILESVLVLSTAQ